MSNHGTAYSLGQYNEVHVAVTRALPKALEGTDPNQIISALWNRGEALEQGLSRVFATMEENNPFLRLISGGEKLVLDPTDGSEILAEADDVFACIDRDFNADEPGEATGKIAVCVWEMVKDATYAQMFSSLSSDMGKLRLTQAQIKGFVKKQGQWLRRDGYATFFLFKSYGNFFVANVRVNSDGRIEVYPDSFESENQSVWHAPCHFRLVVPQLA